MAAPVPGSQTPTPVQISPEWWMSYAPTGHPYYHNIVTKETTWSKPDLAPVNNVCHSSCNSAPVQTFPQACGSRVEIGAINVAPQHAYMQQTNTLALPFTAAGEEPDIKVTGSGHIPRAWTSFGECQFPRNLIDPMLAAGFQQPSSIQQHAWPILFTGRDVIGIAKTGSGKTLSFLLPGFTKMLMERIQGSPLMLVMAPTRELACQIDADAKKFATSAGIVTALAYGGTPKSEQMREIRKRPHLLTGTPGRLNDFLEGNMLSLRDVRFLVLDEADRMLDMGFEPQIRKVIANSPPRRQTLMFTATWPKEVRKMAEDFFTDPIEIRIGNADELKANMDIDQQVIVCLPRDKDRITVDLIHSFPGQVILFTGTKKMCDTLARSLERMGTRCEAIHGDRDQASRDRALAAFKTGAAKVLVATDVAARGLDVKDVKLVINYDPANNAEDYVHRIGRTGRAGQKGTAISLLTDADAKKAADIASVMAKTGKPLPPELERLAGNAPERRARRPSRSRSGGRRARRGRGGKGGDGDGSRSRSRGRAAPVQFGGMTAGMHPSMHPGGVHQGSPSGMHPGMVPGMQPGTYPGHQPGMYPNVHPGMYPSPHPQPGMYPSPQSGMHPSVQPLAHQAMQPGMRQDMTMGYAGQAPMGYHGQPGMALMGTPNQFRPF